MAKTSARSEQEARLAALMQRSFGTADFYWPIRVDTKEPFDLLWHRKDLAVMFFLTSSQRATTEFNSLRSLVHHNVDQYHRMQRLWATGMPKWRVQGKNPHGIRASLDNSKIRRLLVLSVINVNAGIICHQVRTDNNQTMILATIPECVIDWIASIHGTIVDVLSVIHSYLVTSSPQFNPTLAAQLLNDAWIYYRTRSHEIRMSNMPRAVNRQSLARAFRFLAEKRTIHGSKTVMEGEAFNKFMSVVADLAVHDYNQCAFALACLWEQWWFHGRHTAVAFSSGSYDFYFGLIRDPQLDTELLDSFSTFSDRAKSAGRGALGILFLLMPVREKFKMHSGAMYCCEVPSQVGLHSEALFSKIAESAGKQVTEETRRLTLSEKEAQSSSAQTTDGST